jgi:hypothetical protein
VCVSQPFPRKYIKTRKRRANSIPPRRGRHRWCVVSHGVQISLSRTIVQATYHITTWLFLLYYTFLANAFKRKLWTVRSVIMNRQFAKYKVQCIWWTNGIALVTDARPRSWSTPSWNNENTCLRCRLNANIKINVNHLKLQLTSKKKDIHKQKIMAKIKHTHGWWIITPLTVYKTK